VLRPVNAAGTYLDWIRRELISTIFVLEAPLQGKIEAAAAMHALHHGIGFTMTGILVQPFEKLRPLIRGAFMGVNATTPLFGFT